MNQAIDIAKKVLLEPGQLSEQQLQTLVGSLLGRDIDHADLYFQALYCESWVLEEGIVKNGSYDIDHGVGIRAVAGEKTGFAYSDDIVLPALTDAASAAKSIARTGGEGRIQIAHALSPKPVYPGVNPLESLAKADKIHLLEALDREARQCDPRITQVTASLHGTYEIILIVNSEGELVADIRPMVRVNVSVVAEEKGRREKATAGGGGRSDYQRFVNAEEALGYAREAVRQAVLNLHAVDAPAGSMPVVMGSGWNGVLLHEAVGHGLEGDFNRKGVSAFSGRLGERVASPGVTVVDNGTLADRRGSLTIDDEGTPSQCTVLIEDGILKNYMQDKLNARLMKMASTGNCRRESFAHIPIPRMTNTYMYGGSYAPGDIIASVEKGLYVANLGGGQVDITSGQFVFSTSEAYLIEQGKVTQPVKGATLIGSGPEAMQHISMIGDDLALDPGVGVCGKEGQSVPVGVGQPTIKIDRLTVGGTGKS